MSKPIPYLRPREAANYCSVSMQTLYNWMNKGILKSYIIGGTRLLRVSDIDAMIEAGGHPPLCPEVAVHPKGILAKLFS